MTPKEKAEELVNKFMSIKNIKLSDYSYIELPTAKHCALIAVDEILSANHIWYKGTIPYNYWIEVKQKIEAL